MRRRRRIRTIADLPNPEKERERLRLERVEQAKESVRKLYEAKHERPLPSPPAVNVSNIIVNGPDLTDEDRERVRQAIEADVVFARDIVSHTITGRSVPARDQSVSLPEFDRRLRQATARILRNEELNNTIRALGWPSRIEQDINNRLVSVLECTGREILDILSRQDILEVHRNIVRIKVPLGIAGHIFSPANYRLPGG